MTRVLSAVAWPYANGPRHIGHVAGFGVPSDVFSRYMRMAGHDVLMVSGTDEHGTPILVQAEKEGLTPKALADRYNRVIVEDLAALGLSYDLFTRTTTRNHYAVAQELFRVVHRNGYMIEKTTVGAISPSTGRTLPDRYIEGTCPICGYDGARGDQCDNCGNQLDAAELQLPTEVVSSEFLTMEGGKFSSSRGVVIYVRDMLARYQPDALRYFIAVAGPENQDTDFTWAEFVRRTNDELVAGWGNLVNRVASMINKNLGAIPEQGELTDADHHLLAATETGFTTVGDLLGTHRQKQAIGEAMRVVADANKYLSDQAPWKLRTADPERMKTVLHVAAQAVSSCRTMLSPFLPHSAQAVHEALGGTGTVSPMPRIDEVEDLDGGPGYPVLRGDYRRGETLPVWEPAPIVPGTPVPPPTPVFRKLDESVVAEELTRLEETAAG